MKATTYAVPLALLAGLAGCQVEAPIPQKQAATPASPSTPASAVSAAPVRTFDVPQLPIASVRIQPTGTSEGKVAFSQLVLVQDGQETQIDLCGDRRLQLVRSRKIGRQADGSCMIEFGNQAGGGWIAPSQLRSLEAVNGPRQLQIAAAGELTSAFRVYFDVGKGYSSKDMVQVDNEAAVAVTPD